MFIRKGMITKVRARSKLPKMGKFFGISSTPIPTRDQLAKFLDQFDFSIKGLIYAERFAASSASLDPALTKSADEVYDRLFSDNSTWYLLEDFLSAMAGVWTVLKEREDIEDPNDLIAKLLSMTVLIRQKRTPTGFGSKSKGARDKVLELVLDAEQAMKRLDGLMNESSGFPVETAASFAEAYGSFTKFFTHIASLRDTTQTNSDKTEALAAGIGTALGSSGSATELINCLSSDLVDAGFEIREEFKNKRWRKQIRDRKEKRTKTRKARR